MATDLAKIRDRTVVEVLSKLGFPLSEMVKIIPEMYGKDGPSRNTIGKILDSIEKGTFSYLDSVPVGKIFNPELIKLVFQHVSFYPYDSLRQIARGIGSNKDTVRAILRTKLRMRRRKLKWVPHFLTDEQKLQRVNAAKEMLKILSADEKHDFKHIITGDETWLFFQTFQEAKWTREGSEVETRVRPAIGTKKQTLAVKPLKMFFLKGLELEERIYIHMDNAPCHRAAISRNAFHNTNLIEMPQPPYSPDLAPCDFFLFGYLKNRMKGFHFRNSESLLEKAQEIVSSIPRSVRPSVFHDWIERLETVVRIGGEYL
jgi:histone-lysine N-methyltransferase SETMAR